MCCSCSQLLSQCSKATFCLLLLMHSTLMSEATSLGSAPVKKNMTCSYFFDWSWKMRSESCLSFTDACLCEATGYIDLTPCPKQFCDGPDAPPMPYDQQLDKYGHPLVKQSPELNGPSPLLFASPDRQDPTSTPTPNSTLSTSPPTSRPSNHTLNLQPTQPVSPAVWIILVVLIFICIACTSLWVCFDVCI